MLVKRIFRENLLQPRKSMNHSERRQTATLDKPKGMKNAQAAATEKVLHNIDLRGGKGDIFC